MQPPSDHKFGLHTQAVITYVARPRLDAGTRDEWYLDLGAQAFRAQLRAVGLPNERVHFELFDAGHRGIDYRYPLALAWLCHRITDRIH